MCGYQGWFNAEGDGAGRGFHHWTKHAGSPAPGNVKVDLWPDLSEFGPDERFPTNLHRADGTAAEVAANYTRGERVYAIACRVEQVPTATGPRWQVVALHLG
jgi:hypothetical protein